MNKHIVLAILLISMFFIFTMCGAREMFASEDDMVSDVVADAPVDSDPVMMEVANDVVADVPVASDPVITEAASPIMNPDFDVDFAAGQPAAPLPSTQEGMGYYNFAKVMYM